MDNEYEGVARLIRVRNAVDRELAGMIERPMTTGHLGEWLASRIFGIDLHARASHAGSDGTFSTGPMTGKSVNIKWYLKREGSLDVSLTTPPDVYLVLTGPHSTATTSRGELRPLTIDNVYLFDHSDLVDALSERGAKIGIASSVVKSQWADAEVYPAESPLLPLSEEQRTALGLLRDTR
ncbi:hypothetical protein [Pseudonocardia alni]|uniref:hypothetical protein n=1 Tax=Pseudonocardia alni TaxID=33907 RepID=UPI00279A1CA1|nr:hypothetical protein PaSha_01460 [Pseudonocardia alni]